MKKVKYLVLGAGVSGLAFAYEKRNEDVLVIEKDKKPGGLCQSFFAPGFVWDVAGHFLHFHSEETKHYVLNLLQGVELAKVNKVAKIYYGGKYMSAPFQYNIHQLQQEEFLQCLTDLYYAQEPAGDCSFKDFVKQKFGKGISEKFLIPYNEKLYACDLDDLEKDSMGKFLPRLSFDMLMSFYKGGKGETYNDYFLYPRNGIVEIINVLVNRIGADRIHLEEEALSVDYQNKTVITTRDEYHYKYLISTIPLKEFSERTGVGNTEVLHSNKIVILNLGFDLPSIDKEVNWIYYPGDEVFYRVGCYNNIAYREKLSLYVEIGCKSDADVDIDSLLQKTLVDLKRVGLINKHQLEAYHSIVVKPAYVHISKDGARETHDIISEMNKNNVFMLGRYARWEYSAMDDSIEQAIELAKQIV